jgi:hypothetical protein
MPLTKAQEKVVKDGCAACKDWADACARMRALGFPDEAMEERCRATSETYKAAGMIVDAYNSQQMGTKDGTR